MMRDLPSWSGTGCDGSSQLTASSACFTDQPHIHWRPPPCSFSRGWIGRSVRRYIAVFVHISEVEAKAPHRRPTQCGTRQ